MSIKTSKRIALGVIAGLVFAPFAAVVPANAALLTSATAAQTVTVLTGVQSTLGSLVLTGIDVAVLDTITVGAPTGPEAGTITIASIGGADIAAGANVDVFTVGTGGTITEALVAGFGPNGDVTSKVILGTVSRPGTYSITIGGATLNIVARSLAYTTGDGAPVSPFSTGAGVAGVANTVTVTAHSTQVVNQKALVTVSGAGATIQSATSATISADFLSAVVNAQANSPVVIKTPTAGTVTVSLFNETSAGSGLYATTAANIVTITVTAAASTGVFNVAKSTAILSKVATIAAADEVVVADNRLAVTAQAANIEVTVLDANGAAVTTGTVSATISGPGLLGITSDSTDRSPLKTGRVVSAATVTTPDDNKVIVGVWPDNTGAGVATVTISVGATVLATKTITFYGALASYSVTVDKAHVANTGVAEADVFSVTAKDSAGTAIPSELIYASAGTSTIGSVQASVATGSTGVAKFTATGLVTKFGAVPVTFGNAATSATVTATSAFGVSSPVAAAITITSDKTSYLPGELMTITFTAKDANGLGLPNDSYAAGTLLASSAPNPLPSHSFPAVPFLGTAAVALKAGVATANVYAPLVEGPVNFVWTLRGTVGDVASANLAAALQGTKITLAVNVAKPVVPVVVPPVVYEKPTLTAAKNGGRTYLSGVAIDGEGDIIIYVKRIGTTTWKERAKTLEVTAPGDFNGSIRNLNHNIVMRVKQEGTGLFSNQVIVLK